MLSSSGEPFCSCRDLNQCPREYKLICGSDKKVYRNLCVLKAESCRENKTVYVMEEKECGKNDLDYLRLPCWIEHVSHYFLSFFMVEMDIKRW